MSSDFLNSTTSTAFPSTASSAASSPKIRQRTALTASSDVPPYSPGTAVSGLPDKMESILEGTRSRGSQIGRNVIEGLQLDKLGERMSKLEMPDLKLTPNMDVDSQ
jgi:hypothetical protein